MLLFTGIMISLVILLWIWIDNDFTFRALDSIAFSSLKIAIGFMLYLFPPLYGEGYGLINNLLNGNTEVALSGIQYQIDFNNICVVTRKSILGNI